MKDDKIKKCLIAGYDMNIISQEELNEYWNYITNLREENKELKDNLEVIDKSACFWEDTSDNYKTRMNNYLSRIDKAIEYIHNHQLVFELSSKKQIQYWFDMFYKDLINILQGSDK